MFRRILVPVDLSEPENDRIAVREAGELAALGGASIRVVTVLPADAGYVSAYLPDDVLRQAAAEATSEIKALTRDVLGPQTDATAIARRGNVYDEILREARDWGADLIVMRSHRPAMSTYLIGSNAARVVRHATCSVLVLRGGE